MMVKVYAEDLSHTSAELWAVFESEEIYDACADALDELAAKSRMVITVNVDEQEPTKAEAFWQWIDECPKGVYVNHDFTDDEDNQKIHVFGFAVPKEGEDE